MSKKVRCGDGRGRRWTTAASALLVLMAAVLATVALGAFPAAAPRSPLGEAAPTSHAEPTVRAGSTSALREVGALPASPPTGLTVPAIEVRSSLQRLTLASDGSIEVPRAPRYDEAGWFDGSPTPGEPGPAVLVGHLDGAGGVPSVFFRLNSVRRGDDVQVDRADGRTLTFEVYRIEHYPKDDFPTEAVYGDTRGPELRLITCAGSFDREAGRYRDNTVVYARLSHDDRSRP